MNRKSVLKQSSSVALIGTFGLGTVTADDIGNKSRAADPFPPGNLRKAWDWHEENLKQGEENITAEEVSRKLEELNQKQEDTLKEVLKTDSVTRGIGNNETGDDSGLGSSESTTETLTGHWDERTVSHWVGSENVLGSELWRLEAEVYYQYDGNDYQEVQDRATATTSSATWSVDGSESIDVIERTDSWDATATASFENCLVWEGCWQWCDARVDLEGDVDGVGSVNGNADCGYL